MNFPYHPINSILCLVLDSLVYLIAVAIRDYEKLQMKHTKQIKHRNEIEKTILTKITFT